MADQEKKGSKPDFSVKANGEFVGSGWLNEGKYGPYVTIIVNADVAEGERLFIAPRRGRECVLGG